MPDIRLSQFPAKTTPIGADIIYVGDSTASFAEVQSTLNQVLATGFATSLLGANIGTSGSSTITIGNITGPTTTTIAGIINVGTTGSSAISIGTGTYTGTATIGGNVVNILANSTGNVNIGNALNTINIGNTAALNSIVNIQPNTGNGDTKIAATAGQTGTVTIGNSSGPTTITMLGIINIGTASATNAINMGTAGARTITIGNGASPSTTTVAGIINAGITGSSAINIGTGTYSGTISIGNSSATAISFAKAITITPTTNQIILGTTNTITITAPSPAASITYTIPDAGAAANFILSNSANTQFLTGPAFYSSSTNILIGQSAGDSSITTEATVQNVILGAGAATALNSSSGVNVIIGYQAAQNATAITNNILIGKLSGQNLSNSNNIGIGIFTLIGNGTPSAVTGSGNIAIGTSALTNITTGSNNVVNGGGGQQVSTGSNNTGVGNGALGNTLTTGSQNVCIGASTTVNATGAANRIGLGYNISLTNDNQAVIGNSSVTSIINASTSGSCNLGTTANPFGNLILGVSSSSNVTISPDSQAAARTYTIRDYGGAANFALTTAANGKVITQVTKQVFTSSGTYTPTAGMVYCIVEAVGGSGGGGGATSIAGQAGAGGGGGGGGYARSVLTSATVGASQTVTIGAAGAAGAAGNNAGGNGGDTSLGTLVIGKGGTGGAGGASGAASAGGAGGIAGTGDLTFPGGAGGYGAGQAVVTIFTFVGYGGSSHLGFGAAEFAFNGSTNGTAGSLYGGGGTGGGSWNGGATASGGAGTKGVIFITEYIAV